tara:strand:+ start:15435 stop:16682 length:1248 start_codon:yes stop_codon:yes gene_type:complete
MASQFGFLREVSESFAHQDIDSPNSVAGAAVTRLAVNGTSTATKIHKYPLFIDRGKQNSKIEETARECIRFTAVKQGGVTFKNGDLEAARKSALAGEKARLEGMVNTSSMNLMNLWHSTTLRPTKEVQEKIDAANNIMSTAQEKRQELTDDPDNLRLLPLGIEFGKQVLARARTTAQNVEHCFLYMPASVVYNEGATWGMESIGAMGNAAKSLIKGKGDIGSILSDFGAGMAAPVAKAAALGVGAKIAGAFGALGVALGGGGVVSGMSQATRVVQNPYEEQLFSGIPFRVFNFNFEFIATSKTEFQEVARIIKMFRSHSRPTFSIDADADGNQSEALYSYPNEFSIEFMHLSESDVFQRNEHLPRLHNCVLTNITTNYAPDGWSAHEDGEPASIVVQLAFTETKKNTRHEVEEGY